MTTTTTCSGASPSGQQLSYDAQGRLSLWQDQASAPTQTVNYLYDGSGSRLATQSTANGTTTLTSYIGSIEEVQTTGSSTQTTTYYAVGSTRVAADVNGTFYYFGYDALGSQVAVLDASGNLVGAQLYGPYGASRYNTGTLPTSIGFTGQRADTITGLDYYNARYYDPGVGQFLSVDSVQGNAVGMDPYAYVGGNPETDVDPTGNNCYDPTTQTVKVGCGDYKPQPSSGGSGSGSGSGSSAGSGSGTTTKPTQSNPPSPPARQSHKKPTRDQINNAKSVASSASSYFGMVAVVAGGLSKLLFYVSAHLIEWGAQIVLASEGPWAFLTIPLGLSLLALGALASVFAWQLVREAGVLTSLAAMFFGENRMADSWWTPAAVQGFATAAKAVATAVSVAVAALSFVSKLPGKIPASLLSQAGTEGAFLTGRTLGVSAGMLSGAAIDNQVDYYTGLENNCLTQSSCVTN